MNGKVDIAVLDNIVWCGIVCETHGIRTTLHNQIWKTASKSPTFYPDMITASSHVTIEEIKEVIGSREVFSIKDSFATLDLTPLKYELLFTAEWIYHAPAVSVESAQSGWDHVTTEKNLVEWTAAHGSANAIGPGLLRRRDVKIYMKKKMGNVAGFIANAGAQSVGISNVFTSVNGDTIWPDIRNLVSVEFPGVPMVGYERGADLTAALESGWTAVGPLRVWVRNEG